MGRGFGVPLENHAKVTHGFVDLLLHNYRESFIFRKIPAMRALKTLLIILLAVIALVVVLGLTGPRHTTVSRSTVVQAPVDVVYAHGTSLQRMDAWSPWLKRDPNIEVNYSAEHGAVGQRSTWAGNADVGKGAQEIIAMEPSERVRVQLEFIEPFEASATADLSMEAMGDSTRVTWAYSGDNGFFQRIFLVFNDMEVLIGPDFEEGLEQLRVLAEQDAAEQSSALAARTFRGYVIETIERPAMNYLGRRQMVKWADMPEFYGISFQRAAETAGKSGLQLAGPASALFYSWDEAGQRTDMFAGFPVQAQAGAPVEGLQWAEVPAGKVLMTIHRGNHDQSMEAHFAMDEMIKAKGFEMRAAVIEEYITDPTQDPDTANWVTHIYYPIK